EVGALEVGGGEAAGEFGRPERVDDAAAVLERLHADGAVEQAGVEMGEAEVRGEGAADGTLAGGGWAVDGDGEGHQPVSLAPRQRMSSTKLGKLVAMVAASSIVTGWRAARPRQRKDMAMRWSSRLATVAPPVTPPGPRPCTMR